MITALKCLYILHPTTTSQISNFCLLQKKSKQVKILNNKKKWETSKILTKNMNISRAHLNRGQTPTHKDLRATK